MKTRQQFIDLWKRHVAGMALFGVASEIQDGPIVRASKILEIPGEVERLLGRMFDDLTAEPAKPIESARPAPLANGQPTRPVQTGVKT